MVDDRPEGTRCHREKQLRDVGTAASPGVDQGWSHSNGGVIFPHLKCLSHCTMSSVHLCKIKLKNVY